MPLGTSPSGREPKQDEVVRRQWRALALATSATAVLVVAILIGWGIGTFLENRFPTGGLLLAGGLLLGAIAGFVEMFQLVRRAFLESKDQ